MDRIRQRWQELQHPSVGGAPNNRWVVVRQWIWASWWIYLWAGMLILLAMSVSGDSFRIAGLDVSSFVRWYFVALGVYIVFALIYYPVRWLKWIVSRLRQ